MKIEEKTLGKIKQPIQIRFPLLLAFYLLSLAAITVTSLSSINMYFTPIFDVINPLFPL
ncbi:hypothetical protein YC2023_115728 [Brassica napus]